MIINSIIFLSFHFTGQFTRDCATRGQRISVWGSKGTCCPYLHHWIYNKSRTSYRGTHIIVLFLTLSYLSFSLSHIYQLLQYFSSFSYTSSFIFSSLLLSWSSSKVVMDVADIIIEDFLYQNAFSDHDYFCPLPKSVSRLILLYAVSSVCMSIWLVVWLAVWLSLSQTDR